MDQLLSYAAVTFLGLFPITNPIGVIPTFYSLTFGNTAGDRGRQSRQVAINVIVVLAVFLVAGQLILQFFGLSLGALQIAGGVLLAQTAWAMMTAAPSPLQSDEELSEKRDITLIPMTVPIISGPGAIGMVIRLIAQDPQPANYAGSLIGIVGIGAIVYICLALGEPVVKMLGRSGINTFTKVLGFFILAIAIQLMGDGAFALLREFNLAAIAS
ncbi:MAG: NAAT family transporter [Cyanobacteria bacterium P01_F01_bin.150]